MTCLVLFALSLHDDSLLFFCQGGIVCVGGREEFLFLDYLGVGAVLQWGCVPNLMTPVAKHLLAAELCCETSATLFKFVDVGPNHQAPYWIYPSVRGGRFSSLSITLRRKGHSHIKRWLINTVVLVAFPVPSARGDVYHDHL